MKNIGFIILIGFISAVIISCVKTTGVNPQNSNVNKSDTSTTLISNTELVGNWNVVSDSVSTGGIDTIYHGAQADHYTFTKYSNLYLKCAFNQFIDTGVYTISSGNQLSWHSLYGGVLGVDTKQDGYYGGYIVTSVTAHSLVLTSNTISPATGARYEEIIFKK